MKRFKLYIARLRMFFKNINNKTEKKLLSWNLKKIVKVMVIVACITSLIGGYFWYSRIYMSNDRRFWLAIDNSMATTSVTRTLISGGSGNEVVQDQQFFFSPQMATRSHVSFDQKTSTINTAVETEGVSFVDAQYSRYTAFRTNQTKSDGTEPKLDSILGKWEVSEYKGEETETSKYNYLSEYITLAVFGNYNSDFRKQIVDELRNQNVYQVDAKSATQDEVDGRKVLKYTVTVKLKEYTTLLQKAFYESGYGYFAPLDPSNYRDGATISTEISIDKSNNTIVSIKYGSRKESYRGYGININVDRPDAEFSDGELEQIVQKEIETAL